jgi:hypothetical protein
MYKRKKKYNQEKESDLQKIKLHLKKIDELRIDKRAK